MAKFLVLPFKLVEPESGIKILISQRGHTRLPTSDSTLAIEKINKLGWGAVIDSAFLKDASAIIERCDETSFSKTLQEFAILREVEDDFFRFASIRLIHDRSVRLDHLPSDLAYLTGIPCSASLEAEGLKNNELVVLYTPSHDASLILRTQRAVEKLHNSPLLVCYLNHRTLILDGLYIPSANTPCHFCQLNAMRGISHMMSSQPNSWTKVVSEIAEKSPLVGLQYEIIESDHSFCSAIIRNRVRELVGPNVEPIHSRAILDRWEMSLDGFQIRREVTDALIECEFCH